MTTSFLNRIRIVLCHPEGSLNIGAVCRSMENMGISKLTLVGDMSGIDTNQVKMMALHALPIFENARVCDSLNEALSETVMAAGISRRRGKHRKKLSYLPEELASMAAATCSGEMALVFGNEQNGLSDNEMAACTMACHIPGNPKNPSLNLSHAVQLLCYVFFRQSEAGLGDRSPVPLLKIEALADTVESTLKESGYYDKPDRYNTRLFFRDIFARAALSEKEADHLEKVFQKLKHLNLNHEESK
jgi:tRNA/rRNA methyltransferase